MQRHRTHPRPDRETQAFVQRSARSGALLGALHDAHARPGGARRIPRIDDPPVHGPLPRPARHHLGAVHQPGQDESERSERKVLDELPGLQPLAGGQRRELVARRSEQGHPRRHVARIFQGRAAHRLRDQRRALLHLVRGQPATALRQIFPGRVLPAGLLDPGLAEGA